MRNLIVFELSKIWRKRGMQLFALAICLLNVFLLWYVNLPDSSEPALSSYKALWEEIAPMTEPEKQEYIETLYQDIEGVCFVRNVLYMQALGGEMGEELSRQEMNANPGVFEQYDEVFLNEQYLKYTDSLEQEEALIREIYDEMETVFGYGAYLEDIQADQERLNGISIFSSGDEKGFSRRNIEKCAADYAGMETVRTEFFPSKGIVCAMQSRISEVLLILMTFLFAADLIYEEKEKRLFSVTRASARGRGESIAAKLAALGISCIAAAAVIYGSNLLFFSRTAGIGSLFCSIQSAAPFLQSNLKINLLGFICLSVFTKAAVLFVIGAVIICASVFFAQSFMAYLAGALLLAVNLLLYHLIPAWSSLNWLRAFSLCGLMRTEELYGSYLNFDLLGYPISRLAFSLTVLCIYIAAGIAAAVLLFLNCRNLETRQLRIARRAAAKAHGSLLRHEGYKLLIMNRAALVLVLFCALTAWRYFSARLTVSEGERYYQNMMMQLEGVCTPEKETLIKDEQERYECAFEELARIDELVSSGALDEAAASSMKSMYYGETAFYPFFQRVLEQYEYIGENGGEFIYDTGWLYLFGRMDDSFLWDMLLSSACIIFAFANAFAMEYERKSWGLLAATERGRGQVVKKKVKVCMTAAAFVGLVPWICRGICVSRVYPLHSMSVSLKNIPAYAACADMPLAIWLFLSVLIQIAVLLFAALAVCLLSDRLKTHLRALSAGALLLLFPLILKAMGFDFAGRFSLLPLYSWAGGMRP